MKIALISDLHGAEPPRFEPVDLVLIAGDINTHSSGLYEMKEVYPGYEYKLFAVAGNHEYYHSDYEDMFDELDWEGYSETSTFISNNDFRLLSCTLWTDFELYGPEKKARAMDVARQGLNDFRLIGGWTPERSVEVFKWGVGWMTEQLNKPFSGKTIVMTHHCPSHKSISPKYGTDLLNACFASNLDHLFPHVDLWVHGHTHTPCDYTVGRCRVVCNPMGYRGENPGPYKAKIIEV